MRPRVLSLTGYHGTSPPEHCSRCSPSKKLVPRKRPSAWPDAEPTCGLLVGALVPALVSLLSFVSPCLIPPANAQVAPAAVSVVPRDCWRDTGQRCPATALLVATVEEGDAPHQPAQCSFMGDRACPSACPPRSQPQLSRRLASRDTYHPSFMQLPTCPSYPHKFQFGAFLIGASKRGALLPALGGHMDSGVLIHPVLPVSLLQAEEFLTL